MQRFKTFLAEEDSEYSQTFDEFTASLPKSKKEWSQALKAAPGKVVDRTIEAATSPLAAVRVAQGWKKLNNISAAIEKTTDPAQKRALEIEYDKAQLELDKNTADLAIQGTALELGGAATGVLTAPTGVGPAVGVGAYGLGVAANIGSGLADIRSGMADVSQGQYWDATTRIGSGALSVGTSIVGGWGGLKALGKEILIGRQAVKTTTGVEKNVAKGVAQRKTAELTAKTKEAANAARVYDEVDAAVRAGTRRPVDEILAGIDKAEAELAAQKAARLKARADTKLAAKESQYNRDIKAATQKAWRENAPYVGAKGIAAQLKALGKAGLVAGLGAAYVGGKLMEPPSRGGSLGGEGGPGGGSSQMYVSPTAGLGGNVRPLIGG